MTTQISLPTDSSIQEGQMAKEQTGRPARLQCSRYTLFLLLLVLAVGSGCSDSNADEAAQFFLRGNLQLQKREYREAIRYYTEALDKKPDFADAYNNRGLAKYRNGDREGALADYNRAIDTDPDFGATYLNRAEVRLETGDAAGSLADLQRIEREYKDSSFYQVRLADSYVRLNKLAPAQAAYDRAVQLDPKNAEALTNRGALLYSQKAYEQAESDIRQALLLNPKQDAALNNLSLLLARARNYTDALTYVERALLVQPNQPYYLNNKAYLLLMLNRSEEALPLVQESLRLDPDNAWAHRTAGIYYLNRQEGVKALASFRQAERLDASVDDLYYYLGRAEQASGDRQAACEAWQRGESAGDLRAGAERRKQCI